MASSLDRTEIKEPYDGFGFSTKVLLAAWLDERLSILTQGAIRYFAWFAPKPNPIDNIDSSNPMLIFVDIDTAVQGKQDSNQKVLELRRKMVAVIHNLLPPDHPEIESLLHTVLNATLEGFRPQMWAIDLARFPESSYTMIRSGEFMTTGFTLPRSCIREALP